MTSPNQNEDQNENQNQNGSQSDGPGDDDEMSELDYRETVSQLIRITPPSTFKHSVEDTIRRRSDGRFFGRKAFGERIPYELIAVLVLAIGLAAFFIIRSSTTGSLRYEKQKPPPKMAPGARDVVPQPSRIDSKETP